MKLYGILCAFLFSCITLQAQTVTTAPNLVLAAYTHTLHNGVAYIPTDSGVLNYDSGFSYNFKTHTYQFDTTFGYRFNSSGYTAATLQVETYDTNKNLAYDLTLRKDMTGTWMDTLKLSYTYDDSNNILSVSKQVLNVTTGVWKNLEKHLYTYDLRGNRLSDLYQTWSDPLSAWTFKNKYAYTYNSKNTLVADTLKNWDIRYLRLMDSFVNGYTYDTSGRMTLHTAYIANFISTAYTFSYATLYKYEYEYDPLTKDLAIKKHESPDASTTPPAGGFVIDSIIYYTFDTSHNLTYEENPHYYNNTFTYDTAHNLLSATYIVWNVGGPIRPSLRYFYSYNSDNLVTVQTAEIYNNVVNRWLGQTQDRYYYKTPPPPKKPINTGINTTSLAVGSIQLYPSPANSILNIDIRSGKEEAVVIAIYDVQGKIWSQWQTEPALFSHSNIPVAQMPAGNYILTVRNENGHVSRMFTIVH